MASTQPIFTPAPHSLQAPEQSGASQKGAPGLLERLEHLTRLFRFVERFGGEVVAQILEIPSRGHRL
jgi:hypothetical protein